MGVEERKQGREGEEKGEKERERKRARERGQGSDVSQDELQELFLVRPGPF